MKIQLSHYNYMKSKMAENASRIPDHIARIKDDPRIKDLDKRIRWDWLYGSIPSSWICDNLYPYMDDTHIDTALRAIVKDLKF